MNFHRAFKQNNWELMIFINLVVFPLFATLLRVVTNDVPDIISSAFLILRALYSRVLPDFPGARRDKDHQQRLKTLAGAQRNRSLLCRRLRAAGVKKLRVRRGRDGTRGRID